MKKVLYALVAVIVVGGLVGGATLGPKRCEAEEGLMGGLAPTVVIQPSHVLRLDKSTKVAIMGSGFKPGEEIHLLITQSDGSISDITSELVPEPKANEFGVWGTAWTVGDYSSSSVAEAGLYILKACDANYEVLTTVPFGYYDTKKPYKDWPSWAQTLVKEPAPAPAPAKK
jgi:hypothetical protein